MDDFRRASDAVKKFERSNSKAMDNLNRAGKKMQGFGRSVGRLGDSLTNKITKPAIVAGAALGGIVIGKGFKRLVAIDSAKAKLEALGHSGKDVDLIMTSANESVLGTSYGLDEAATAAASAVAAGIKPGKELTKYLSIAADTAAVAGTDFNEMGDIFGKVQTQNKAYNRELQQLAERGIPIYQWLAEEANVTADEIFDMASSGEISSKMFRDAIDKNIGGAAKIIGEKSFMGALSNLWAAVGRVGAAFLDGGEKGEGMFSKLKPLMTSATKSLDNMQGAAEKAGAKFGDMLTKAVEKAKELKKWFDNLSPAVQSFLKKAALIGTVVAIGIGPALKVVSALSVAMGTIMTVIPKAWNAFRLLGAVIGAVTSPTWAIVAAIAAVGTALVVAYKKSETFRTIVNKTFKSVKDVVMNVVGAISDFVLDKVGFLVNWYEDNQELIKESTDIAWTFVSDKIETVMKFLQPFIEQTWKNIEKVTGIVWDLIGTIVDNALIVITGLLEAGMKIITGDWEGAWETIESIFEDTWKNTEDFLSDTWDTIVGLFEDNLKTLTGITDEDFEFISDTISENLDGALDTINAFWEASSETFENSSDFVTSLVELDFEGMVDAVNNQLNTFEKFVDRAWGNIESIFETSLNTLRGLVSGGFASMHSTISGILSGTSALVKASWSGIRSGVSASMNSIKSGVSSGWSAVQRNTGSWLGRMIVTVTSRFNSLPGIIGGAMSRAVGQITGMAGRFFQAGRNIVLSVARGIESAIGSVSSAMGKVAAKARGFLPFSPAKEGPLRDIMNVRISESIASAIDSGSGVAIKAMQSLTGGLDKEAASVGDSLAFDTSGIDISRRVNSINKQAERQLTHSFDSHLNVTAKQPAYINVSIGNRDFEGFVDDISEVQDRNTMLKKSFA